MKIHLLAVGTRMPSWVESGFQQYARRMPAECQLELIEIPAGHRAKNSNIEKAIQQEEKRLLAAIPKSAFVVALDEHGSSWSTKKLSAQLDHWLHLGQDIALLVGGPDGLSKTCLNHAQVKWSLSPLTLPHPLVRVVLAEQLYRAWSLLQGHPYHRE